MFDFGKNSPIYYSVKVLTLDYLVTGYLGSEWVVSFNVMNEGCLETLVLQNARVTPLRAPGPDQPASFDVPMALVYRDELVGVMLMDDAGCQKAMQSNTSFSHAFKGEVRAGPYLIDGTMLSWGSSLRDFRFRQNFPAKDVEVRCLLPDAPFAPVKAPYMLVIGAHKNLLFPRI